MENRNIPTEQEAHCRLYDRIRGISHESRYRQHACNLLIKEEYMSGHYQDYIRISTNSST